MARHFEHDSAEYIDVGGWNEADGLTVLSCFAWVRLESNDDFQHRWISQNESTGTSEDDHTIMWGNNYSGEYIKQRVRLDTNDGDTRTAIDGTNFDATFGTWIALGWNWSAARGTVRFLHNGVYTGLEQALTGDQIYGDATRDFYIGNDAYNQSNCMDGDMAELALWGGTTVISDAEFLVMAKGVNPAHIRPYQLIGGWHLDGFHSPEPDFSGRGNNGALSGTVKSSHAPVSPPSFLDMADPKGVAAPGGLSIPVAMNSYRQRRTA